MTFLNFKTRVPVLFSAMSVLLISSCGGPGDKEISVKVTKALQANPEFKGITNVVKDGSVTLSGNCMGDGCDSLAIQEIKKVEGVKNVNNQVQHETITDLTLRTSVQSIISRYDGVQADVAAGVVVLRGTIEKKQVEPLMNELQALKPKKLDNQLAVK